MKETLDEQSRLGLHFVSKGIISIDHGKTFNTLFEKRS